MDTKQRKRSRSLLVGSALVLTVLSGCGGDDDDVIISSNPKGCVYDQFNHLVCGFDAAVPDGGDAGGKDGGDGGDGG